MVEPTHLKNMLVKLDHFPRDRGEHIYIIFETTTYIYNIHMFFPHLSGEACSNPRWWLFQTTNLVSPVKKKNTALRLTRFEHSIACNLQRLTIQMPEVGVWGGKTAERPGRWIYHFCPQNLHVLEVFFMINNMAFLSGPKPLSFMGF